MLEELVQTPEQLDYESEDWRTNTMYHSHLVAVHLQAALNLGAFFLHYELHFDY
jgi:hypothetical protein